MQHVVGAYRLEGVLGRGGNATAYRAVHLPSGHPVAFKLLTRPLSDGSSHAKRFQRELHALRTLQHPAIISVLDVGEVQARGYLVLELLDGGDLDARLRNGPLSPARTAELGVALADALHVAHQAQLVHRDVKPANVLFTRDGQPKLTDFGLARSLDPAASRLTRTGSFLGSPGYMSPEQARGEWARLGPPTDVYGLGATLYACLAGHPPVEGESLPEVILRTESGKTTPLRDAAPHVDPALAQIVERALALDPDQRYPTTEALAAALRAYLEGEQPRPPRRTLLWILRLAAVFLAAWIVSLRFATPPPASTLPEPPSATSLLDAARAAHARHDTDAALAALDQLLDAHPNHADGLRQRLELLLHAGRTEAALTDADRLVTLQPDADAHRLRGQAREEQGDAEGGWSDYQRSLELDPEQPRLLLRRARRHLDAGNPQDALSDLDLAIDLTPDDPDLLHQRSFAYAESGDLASAFRDVDRALDLDPQHYDSLLRRAVYHRNLENYPQALADFDRAVALQPDAPLARTARAQLYRTIGQNERAIRDFDALIQRGSSDPEVFAGRGLAYARLGNIDEAIRGLSQAIALDPSSPIHRYNRGLRYLDIGELAQAVEDFEASLQLEPDDPSTLISLGIALGQQGAVDRARACYEAALRGTSPGDPLNQLAREWLSTLPPR